MEKSRIRLTAKQRDNAPVIRSSAAKNVGLMEAIYGATLKTEKALWALLLLTEKRESPIRKS